ncbi:AAA family ATPase [Thermococcus cleftensis]|uniref:AAA family ATPase n=1 Tax=Thermococcus cleftensis (strain DSM 27260 / KACC 17922 / CL1) TaxID=163003 RepID=UPI0011D21FD5|nr:ATP-binding protein [Thermococcus cleftensis]
MVVVYFDTRPKRRREDLYDREEELAEFERSIRSGNPLTVITGIRRLGKTSLLVVGLNELAVPYVLVDFRGVNPNSRMDVYRRIESSVNAFLRENRDLWEELRRDLKNITGLRVLSFGVSFSWKDERTDLIALFRELEKYDVVLAFDEVQYLRGPVGSEFAGIIAHLYDYSDLRMVMTGSEVGLLHDYLGLDDPKAPLYGRYFHEISLHRFSPEQSREFLRIGFEQVGLTPSEELIDLAVERLDGIVGWLVLFGRKAMEKGLTENLVDNVFEEAKALAMEEFENFLSKRPAARKRYVEIMRAVASGRRTWEGIKEHLEMREGRSIADSVLARLLKALVDSSFLEKKREGRNVRYSIPDPILEECFKEK